MRLTVRVLPRSRKNALAWEGDILKVWLTAPAVDGAANKALIDLLAARLKLPKRALHIVQGTTRRQKVLEIADVTPEDIRQRLEN